MKRLPFIGACIYCNIRYTLHRRDHWRGCSESGAKLTVTYISPECLFLFPFSLLLHQQSHHQASRSIRVRFKCYGTLHVAYAVPFLFSFPIVVTVLAEPCTAFSLDLE